MPDDRPSLHRNLIDIAQFLARQELSFRNRNRSDSSEGAIPSPRFGQITSLQKADRWVYDMEEAVNAIQPLTR